jgi:aspartyl-tRNA(Asn)/glutamyl-tRNA(Gln) amidotransferase subunit B
VEPVRAVIGLEVHARLRTRTKLFCRCAAGPGGAPNSRVCPVCLGLPGALPVANREAVRLAVRLAVALEAEVHPVSAWARKNYFYPDLPKGYQISQFERPLATGGRVRIEPPGAAPRWLGVERIHLEEDAGKSLHEGFGDDGSGIDFNRCGVPLVEIVGAPELASPDEAFLYLERLKSTLRATGVSDAEMEDGDLRCDVNVSVHRDGEPWGARVEVKNLNSFRGVRRALQHEIARQAAARRAGTAAVPETRLWDDARGETRTLRGKEEAHDYRYFPEPDLPALALDDALVVAARAGMPELPHARRDRFAAALGLPEADAHRLTVEPAVADYFEQVARAAGDPRAAANWVLTELLGLLRERGLAIGESPVAAADLAELIRLAGSGAISGKTAKEVFARVAAGEGRPAAIVEAGRLSRLDDAAAIESACRAVLDAHPGEAAGYRAGKAALLAFFVGQVMRRTGGRADPGRVHDTLRRLLG